ncbi:MAG TPA: radical SAM family heme chaperone HemW [Thermodesulfobacteriota bacterium]|nr:radical SAM family heme chaperone HemW [Thermodesulfobacteriota bacterium]HZX14585.1 radical SAM family heme chaperone HemW [Thermodesulfobacteriota bacterium]
MTFGAYVHIPYCVKKCPYCDFNSYGVGRRIPEKEYTEAVLKELDFYRESIENLPLTSIFFGGGTPSLFSADSIGKIISKILNVTTPLDSIEISLEVNPKTAELEKLKALKDVGVNRMSVGVQSFSERKLKLLGRINTPDDSRRVLEDIIKAGFNNFNLDLIFGVSFETLDEWMGDLEKALDFNTIHISAYCLTIEDDTGFGALYSQGKLPLPDEDTLAEMLIFTSDFLEQAGFVQYEISNFAKQGHECRHNLLYWRGENYLGLGAGAHSHLDLNEGSSWGVRWANLKNPDLYMRTVLEGKIPLAFTELLSREEAIQDKIMMGLRLGEGINLTSMRDRFGAKLYSDSLSALFKQGFLELSDNSLHLTKKGILVSNELIMKVCDSLVYD